MESERREILAFFWRAWRSPNVAPVGELDVPENRLGTTSFSDSEPSLSPSTSLGPGREER